MGRWAAGALILALAAAVAASQQTQNPLAADGSRNVNVNYGNSQVVDYHSRLQDSAAHWLRWWADVWRALSLRFVPQAEEAAGTGRDGTSSSPVKIGRARGEEGGMFGADSVDSLPAEAKQQQQESVAEEGELDRTEFDEREMAVAGQQESVVVEEHSVQHASEGKRPLDSDILAADETKQATEGRSAVAKATAGEEPATQPSAQRASEPPETTPEFPDVPVVAATIGDVQQDSSSYETLETVEAPAAAQPAISNPPTAALERNSSTEFERQQQYDAALSDALGRVAALVLLLAIGLAMKFKGPDNSADQVHNETDIQRLDRECARLALKLRKLKDGFRCSERSQELLWQTKNSQIRHELAELERTFGDRLLRFQHRLAELDSQPQDGVRRSEDPSVDSGSFANKSNDVTTECADNNLDHHPARQKDMLEACETTVDGLHVFEVLEDMLPLLESLRAELASSEKALAILHQENKLLAKQLDASQQRYMSKNTKNNVGLSRPHLRGRVGKKLATELATELANGTE